MGNNFLPRGTELQLLSTFRFSICFPIFLWYTLCNPCVLYCPQLPLQSWKSM